VTVCRVFVESGPKRRKTMVHVTDLLGCIAQGPTTEDALEATPEAIHTFAAFSPRTDSRAPTPVRPSRSAWPST
jgi:hypothetical protein